jgi:hypothetical protein
MSEPKPQPSPEERQRLINEISTLCLQLSELIENETTIHIALPNNPSVFVVPNMQVPIVNFIITKTSRLLQIMPRRV